MSNPTIRIMVCRAARDALARHVCVIQLLSTNFWKKQGKFTAVENLASILYVATGSAA